MARVSMAMIARKAGVSRNTVSLALRGSPRISVATREKVRRIAEELGYARNPVVAQLLVELRRNGTAGCQRALALLNGSRGRRALAENGPEHVWGRACRERAEAQGYGCDEFWLDDPELDGGRLNRIFEARGIVGGVIVASVPDRVLPERFMPTWEKFPCVVAGGRTRRPALPFCWVDHHQVVLDAVRKVMDLGYKRPALVVDQAIDDMLDGRFSSAMWRAQQALPAKNRIASFMARPARGEGEAAFLEWMERNEPDVLLTLHVDLHDLLVRSGRRIPEDIGLVLLDKHAAQADWAGIDQHHDAAAGAAVDLLISMIHNHQTGIPEFPRATLIGGTWSPGWTVRPQS